MPLVFVSIWAASMELSPTSLTSTITSSECSPSSRMEEGGCWSGWSESPHLFYLIAAPMLVAYAVSSWQDKIHYTCMPRYFWGLFIRSIWYFYSTSWEFLFQSSRLTALPTWTKSGEKDTQQTSSLSFILFIFLSLLLFSFSKSIS